MAPDDAPSYRSDLAWVHHRGFGFHADGCAPAMLEPLEPVREGDGTVLELGCGSGALTRHLVEAGHRAIATDASPAMLELAQQEVPGVEEFRRLALPDDPLAPADAIVSVGHALNHLPDEASIERALVAIAEALRAGGVVAIDLCDLRWAEVRQGQPQFARVADDWAIITEFSVPSPATCAR
ncbi:MAG: class I SAM-dependent methyltransferase [Nitriliruptorales bacterium]